MEEKNLNQIKKFIWIWGILAFGSLVALVGKVLDFQATDTMAHRVALPGFLFVVSVIGLSINRKAYAKGDPHAIPKQDPLPDDTPDDQAQPDDQPQQDEPQPEE